MSARCPTHRRRRPVDRSTGRRRPPGRWPLSLAATGRRVSVLDMAVGGGVFVRASAQDSGESDMTAARGGARWCHRRPPGRGCGRGPSRAPGGAGSRRPEPRSRTPSQATPPSSLTDVTRPVGTQPSYLDAYGHPGWSKNGDAAAMQVGRLMRARKGLNPCSRACSHRHKSPTTASGSRSPLPSGCRPASSTTTVTFVLSVIPTGSIPSTVLGARQLTGRPSVRPHPDGGMPGRAGSGSVACTPRPGGDDP